MTMKKITLMCFMMLGMLSSAVAQTETDNSLTFLDKNNKEVKDGSTITITTVSTSNLGEEQMEIELSLQNKSTNDLTVQLTADLTEMPSNTAFQSCAFGNCDIANNSMVKAFPAGKLGKGGIEALATEWLPNDVKNVSWTCRLSADIMEGDIQGGDLKLKAHGPKINVVFKRGTPTGIDTAMAEDATKEVARYTADGQRVSQPVKGINIIRQADGSIVKQLIK